MKRANRSIREEGRWQGAQAGTRIERVPVSDERGYAASGEFFFNTAGIFPSNGVTRQGTIRNARMKSSLFDFDLSWEVPFRSYQLLSRAQSQRRPRCGLTRIRSRLPRCSARPGALLLPGLPMAGTAR